MLNLLSALTPVLAAGVLLASTADAALGQSNPTPAKAPQEKTKVDKPAPDAPRDPEAVQVEEPEGGVRFRWNQHPSIRFGSVFRIDFQVKLQEDWRESYEGAVDLDPWDFHRNRIGIQGHLFKKIEYEVERELTEKELDAGRNPKSPWKDVNVNLTYIKNAQVKIGKFKIPFGLDQLTGVTNNDFVYRSLGANYLAPSRDIGVMVHGSFLRHGLQYWTGGFLHDGDNARSSKIQGGDRTFAGRVVGTPLRKVTGGLGVIEFGTSYAFSVLSDDSFRPNGLRARTVLTQHMFYEPVYVKGHRRRWEGDVDWTVGRASARTEYTRVTDDRLRQGLGDEDLPNVVGQSWFVSGTWVLAGGVKARPVKPTADFLQGGIGAIELAARYERIWFNSVGGTDQPFRTPRAETIFPAGERALTLGVSWTINRFTKVQLNGIRELVEDVERRPVLDRDAFWSKVVRFQLVL